MEISVFEDGLSQAAVATMAEGSMSSNDSPSYVLDSLLYIFDEETISGDGDF